MIFSCGNVAIRSLGESRTSGCLFDNIAFVEFGIGLGKIEVRFWDLYFSWCGSSTSPAATISLSTSDSINPHLIDLVGQVVHGITATTVAELSHCNCDSGSCCAGGILNTTLGSRNSGLNSCLACFLLGQ